MALAAEEGAASLSSEATEYEAAETTVEMLPSETVRGGMDSRRPALRLKSTAMAAERRSRPLGLLGACCDDDGFVMSEDAAQEASLFLIGKPMLDVAVDGDVQEWCDQNIYEHKSNAFHWHREYRTIERCSCRS